MLHDLPNLKSLDFPAPKGGTGTTGVHVQCGVAMVLKMERSYMRQIKQIKLIFVQSASIYITDKKNSTAHAPC